MTDAPRFNAADRCPRCGAQLVLVGKMHRCMPKPPIAHLPPGSVVVVTTNGKPKRKKKSKPKKGTKR